MTTTQTPDRYRYRTLNRIGRGMHGANVDGHLVLVGGQRGEWLMAVDGEYLPGTAPTLAEATARVFAAVAAKVDA